MGMTLSSRSPAMAYVDGGVWVSTFDEMGERCWFHTVTGQRTYKFIGGKPVLASFALPSPHTAQSSSYTAQSPYPTQSPFATPSPYAAQHSPMPNHYIAPWAQGSSSPAPLPAPTYPAPPAPAGAHGGGGDGGAIISYVPPPGYENSTPPVTPTGNGLSQRLKKYYLRPSKGRSWMWRQ
ncbi:unnamed protein product [Scytosiphon promiscuus]